VRTAYSSLLTGDQSPSSPRFNRGCKVGYCQIAAAPFEILFLLFAPALSRVYNRMILLFIPLAALFILLNHSKRKRDKFNFIGLSLFKFLRSVKI
jgi:hypothetical protein